jgi:opacity protein-like surface antigen
MKTKVFLAAIILIFGSAVLHAQSSDRRVHFTISFQPDVNWMHADESTRANGPIRLGMEGGLRLDYNFERFYALSFGVGLTQTGGNIIYNTPLHIERTTGPDSLMAGTRVTYRLQFVEIPVAIKFILPEIGYSTWFTEIGLDPMFNTNAFIDATDNNIEKEPYKQGISKFNLAWHAGLGMNYSFGRNLSMQFALIYKNTFLDVTRESETGKADNARINQAGLRIGIVF